MKQQYFTKFNEHSFEFFELIKKRGTAFILLCILVDRARKSELYIKDGLAIGEAQTGAGDAMLYGVKRQVYRTDLKLLKKDGLISTIKVTNSGSIVKVVDSSIFDISRVKSTSELTESQPTSNQPLTTKQEERREETQKEFFQSKQRKPINFLKALQIAEEVSKEVTT